MAKPAPASITIRTGLALPLEERMGPKAHGHNELRLATLSKQRLIIAMPSYTRVPSPVNVLVRSRAAHLASAHHGFIRGGIALHNPASSGQHRSPDCVLCNTNMRNSTKKAGGPTTLCGPFFTQAPAAERAENTPSLRKAPRNNHHPDHSVSPSGS